jgi:hypothetical protein
LSVLSALRGAVARREGAGQREVMSSVADQLQLVEAAPGQALDHLVDQDLRRAGAGAEADRAGPGRSRTSLLPGAYTGSPSRCRWVGDYLADCLSIALRGDVILDIRKFARAMWRSVAIGSDV